MQRLVLAQMECFCSVVEEMLQARYGLYVLMIEAIHFHVNGFTMKIAPSFDMRLINEFPPLSNHKVFPTPVKRRWLQIACMPLDELICYLHAFILGKEWNTYLSKLLLARDIFWAWLKCS